MAFSPDYPQIKKKRPSSPIDIVGVDAENLESKRTSYDINRESSITTIPPIKNEMKKMLPAVEEQPFSLCCPKNGPAPISASKGESLTKRSFTGAGDIKGQEPIFSKKETFQDAKQPKAKTPVHSASTSSMQVATSYFDPFETTTSSPMMSAPLSKATKRTEAAQPLRQPSAKAGVPAKEAIPYGTFGPMVLQSYYGVNHKFEGISPVDDYVFLDKVGEGTFGEVHRARHRATGRLVALKRILPMPNGEGFPITSLREIRILKRMNHQNVISIQELALSTASSQGPPTFFIVFPFVEHDLVGLLDAPNIRFNVPQIKYYAKQLLQGVAYVHSKNLLHRDIKSANILVGNRGEVKIADFGLSRTFDPHRAASMTPGVVTRWYRPPELLLGAQHYTTAVDMWGVGCIVAELFLRQPLFQGTSELHQLTLIFDTIGWPRPGMRSLANLPDSSKVPNLFSEHQAKPLHPLDESRIGDAQMLDLVHRLLSIDPDARISAKEALEHPAFTTALPLTATTAELPHFSGCSYHELAKRRRDATNAAVAAAGAVESAAAAAAAPASSSVSISATFTRQYSSGPPVKPDEKMSSPQPCDSVSTKHNSAILNREKTEDLPNVTHRPMDGIETSTSPRTYSGHRSSSAVSYSPFEYNLNRRPTPLSSYHQNNNHHHHHHEHHHHHRFKDDRSEDFRQYRPYRMTAPDDWDQRERPPPPDHYYQRHRRGGFRDFSHREHDRHPEPH
ncbi:CmgC/CDK protein kinase, partial [Mitosporidium daphniae]